MMIDRFNRIHDYLRISLTDSCNFRCTYCMPNMDYAFMPANKLMKPNEIETIVKTFVDLGIKKIKFTGGEPLVRKDFEEIVLRMAKFPVTLSLITNGALLHKHLHTLKKAGVNSINVSLDSLDRETFVTIAQRDRFHRVWSNIMLLIENDFQVKINVVATKGAIEKEIIDFVGLTERLPIQVRFIEIMPFSGNRWNSGKVITAKQMMELVSEKHEMVKIEDEPHSTAKKYQVNGFTGSIAFITTMSKHFCGTCNRLRLTAEGKIKNCLFGKEELDLLGALRGGEPILPLILQSVKRKHAVMGGQFHNGYKKIDPNAIINRSMIAIGG